MIGKKPSEVTIPPWMNDERPMVATGRPDHKNWSLGSLAFQDGIGPTYNFYIKQVTIALLIICNKLT